MAGGSISLIKWPEFLSNFFFSGHGGLVPLCFTFLLIGITYYKSGQSLIRIRFIYLSSYLITQHCLLRISLPAYYVGIDMFPPLDDYMPSYGRRHRFMGYSFLLSVAEGADNTYIYTNKTLCSFCSVILYCFFHPPINVDFLAFFLC